MITKIVIKNFKSFLNADIDIAPLTLLTGLNSSGKSSVLQAVRMWDTGVPLEGHGKMSSLRSKASSDDYFRVTVEEDDAHLSHVCHRNDDNFIFSMQQGADLRPESIMEYQSTDMRSVMPKNKVHYISAARLGPQTSLTVAPESTGASVGVFGERVLEYLLGKQSLSGVPALMRAEGFEGVGSVTSNISEWLNVISPGASYSARALELADVGTINYYADRRPANVGFGLSYTLPIIALLIGESAEFVRSQVAPIVLVENPEAHLHPKGQTAIGRLLAYAAASGIQCIVETHSEHVFNGARLAIKDGSLHSDFFVCHYFKYDRKNEYSQIDTVYADDNGAIGHWPDDFFDELEKTLLKLM